MPDLFERAARELLGRPETERERRRAPMTNRVRGQVRHARRDEADEETSQPAPRPRMPITLHPVPWLAKRLPWWDDDAEFAAALAERKREAQHRRQARQATDQ